MIVSNIGYLDLKSVLDIKHFSIYETNKNTHILVKYTHNDKIYLFSPKKDRLPYKILEGKKICSGKKIICKETNYNKNIYKHYVYEITYINDYDIRINYKLISCWIDKDKIYDFFYTKVEMRQLKLNTL